MYVYIYVFNHLKPMAPIIADVSTLADLPAQVDYIREHHLLMPIVSPTEQRDARIPHLSLTYTPVRLVRRYPLNHRLSAVIAQLAEFGHGSRCTGTNTSGSTLTS